MLVLLARLPMECELFENRQAIHLAYSVTRRMKTLASFRFKLEDTIQRNCLFGQPKLTRLAVHAGTDTVLKDRESYQRQFGSSETRVEVLRWVVQSRETGIRKLSFKDGGIDSLVHVAAMTNMGNPKMKELKGILWTSLVICLWNYPEIICKHVTTLR